VTPGRLAFGLGAVTGTLAVLLEAQVHWSAPAFAAILLAALLMIVVATQAWAGTQG
jgi:hypothetical protein